MFTTLSIEKSQKKLNEKLVLKYSKQADDLQREIETYLHGKISSNNDSLRNIIDKRDAKIAKIINAKTEPKPSSETIEQDIGKIWEHPKVKHIYFDPDTHTLTVWTETLFAYNPAKKTVHIIGNFIIEFEHSFDKTLVFYQKAETKVEALNTKITPLNEFHDKCLISPIVFKAIELAQTYNDVRLLKDFPRVDPAKIAKELLPYNFPIS